jgi:hypothetical protein
MTISDEVRKTIHDGWNHLEKDGNQEYDVLIDSMLDDLEAAGMIGTHRVCPDGCAGGWFEYFDGPVKCPGCNGHGYVPTGGIR